MLRGSLQSALVCTARRSAEGMCRQPAVAPCRHDQSLRVRSARLHASTCSTTNSLSQTRTVVNTASRDRRALSVLKQTLLRKQQLQQNTTMMINMTMITTTSTIISYNNKWIKIKVPLKCMQKHKNGSITQNK